MIRALVATVVALGQAGDRDRLPVGLQPDGRMVMRNSREDTDNTTETGRRREQRFEEWRARLRALRPPNPNAKTSGPP